MSESDDLPVKAQVFAYHTRKRIKIVEFAAGKGVPTARELRETLKKPAGG
jgi:hypothetical protein